MEDGTVTQMEALMLFLVLNLLPLLVTACNPCRALLVACANGKSQHNVRISVSQWLLDVLGGQPGQVQ